MFGYLIQPWGPPITITFVHNFNINLKVAVWKKVDIFCYVDVRLENRKQFILIQASLMLLCRFWLVFLMQALFLKLIFRLQIAVTP